MRVCARLLSIAAVRVCVCMCAKEEEDRLSRRANLVERADVSALLLLQLQMYIVCKRAHICESVKRSDFRAVPNAWRVPM